MSDYTNTDRAKRAHETLRHYVESRGETFEGGSTEISDLIADLLHLTERLDQGDDAIDSTLRVARMHYEAEVAEEGAA